mmetsp:Transcript_3640/g.9215  ORF Transcript_3640/g.9215 Transcript_3640/m.9215 type:complete len:630 (-) Transcript_3640:50-1939(-)
MFGVDEGGVPRAQAPVWPEDADFLARHSPTIGRPEDEVIVVLSTLSSSELPCSGRTWCTGASVKDVVCVVEEDGLKASLLLLPGYAEVDTSLTLLQLLERQAADSQAADRRELRFAVVKMQTTAEAESTSHGGDSAAQSSEEEQQRWEEVKADAIEHLRQRPEQAHCRPQLPELKRKALEDELRMQGLGYVVPGGIMAGVKCIGMGAYGRVIKIERDGKLFAMKRQPLGYFDETSIPLLREVAILNALKRARNIVQLVDAFLARPHQTAEVWTVLELFPGDLHQELCKCLESPMEQSVVTNIIYEILLGLGSMHSIDIVHRDLKPENVLVNWHPTLQVALCDFGVSRSVHGWDAPSLDAAREPPPPPDLRRHFTLTVGTSCWKAPEMWGLNDLSGMEKKDLKSIDIFALGLVWAQMLAGRRVLEFADDDPKEFMLLEILKKVNQPELAQEEWKDLGFEDHVIEFCKAVKDGDTCTVQQSLETADSDRRSTYKEVLQSETRSIAQWIEHVRACQYGAAPSCCEDSLHSITAATRLNYRHRPTVDQLRAESCFSLIRTVSHHDEPALSSNLWDITEEVISQNVNRAKRHSLHAPPEPALVRSVSHDVRQVAQCIQLGLEAATTGPPTPTAL